jgi:hypothetical protein
MVSTSSPLRRLSLCLICHSVLTVFALPVLADVPDEMKVLIEQKRPQDAYALGMKHPEMMGEPMFDYFFGVAAVDSGRISLGVLSLERALLSNPKNDLVRLELARAYFALGEYQRSREEFEEVKKTFPPPGVVSTINAYLDAIKAKENEFKILFGVYAELGMGNNSNVNTAAAINNIILPVFGPVALSSSAQPQRSAFIYQSIGANAIIPIDTGVSGFVAASTTAQKYSQISGYNLNVSNGTVGVKVANGPNLFKVAAIASIAQLDDVPVPNTYGGGGEWIRQLTPTDSVMVGAGSTRLAYPIQYSAYNANLNIGTAGYRKMFPTTMWKPVLDVNANVAHQNDTSNRPDLGRKIAGATVQVSFLPKDRWAVSVGTGYTQSKYNANDLLYQAPRTDNLVSGNLAVKYNLTKELSTRLEFTYFNNLSNLNLYSYDQWTGAIKLRYDWNSN